MEGSEPARELLVNALVESLTAVQGQRGFDAAPEQLRLLSTLIAAVLRYIDTYWKREDAEHDDLTDILRVGQLALLKHPVAAQALFQSFVAEGRRFAATPEGKAWQDRLSGSELIRRGRLVWETATLNLLEERSESPIPSGLLDALASAAAEPELEAVLAGLFANA